MVWKEANRDSSRENPAKSNLFAASGLLKYGGTVFRAAPGFCHYSAQRATMRYNGHGQPARAKEKVSRAPITK
ncbi:hypothetical protein GCM10027093_11570 [Paraburkholderia jirisanensis]